jgi:hypothetical protein
MSWSCVYDTDRQVVIGKEYHIHNKTSITFAVTFKALYMIHLGLTKVSLIISEKTLQNLNKGHNTFSGKGKRRGL